MTPESVWKKLASSAADFAERAAAARENEERPDAFFFLYAATALEHLAKAALCRISPALIANSKFDDLLHAVSRPDLADTPPASRRTISAIEALTRCGQIEPGLKELLPGLRTILESRNGIVHLALDPKQSSYDWITIWLRGVRLLAPHADADFTSLLGDYGTWATTTLSERSSAIDRAVAETIAAARQRYQRRLNEFSPEQLTVLTVSSTAQRATRVGLTRYDLLEVECPACDNQIIVEGTHAVDWDADVEVEDGELYFLGAFPLVTFRPGHLSCSLCGLELDGEEELRTAGLTRVERDDVDERDFYEEAN